MNGRKMVAELDTGSNGTLKLTPAAVSELDLETDVAAASATESVGSNGVAHHREGKIANVTVGGISVDRRCVIFFGKGTGRDHKAWGINIGNAFLKALWLPLTIETN